MRIISAFFLVIVTLLLGVRTSLSQVPGLAIIPEPMETTLSKGNFKIKEGVDIYYSDGKAKMLADLFREFVWTNYGLKLKLKATKNVSVPTGSIFFHTAATGHTEGYHLSIESNGLNLSGDDAGLFYGLQTLQQLVTEYGRNSLVFPVASIRDQPRFEYRGLMLDVSRHFFPLSYVKKFIDVMAQFKFNRFHWHLTDDQGWRMEIKKYPKLQSVGAWREPVDNISDSEFVKNGRYGGYYTQEEVAEVIAYAKERYITVIPEIEMPGHSTAALASYPYLGCTGGPYEVAKHGGITRDVYCPGKESTFKFLEDVLSEVIAVFPSQYIHIGGDETPKDRWKVCPHCQARIKDEKLKDEHGLQSYFVQRMEKFLNSEGRKIIGWDEILEGGLAPNATVMSWRGESGGIAAARQSHDVIMSPYTYLYLDYYQGNPKWEPPAFPAHLPLKKVYSYEPLSDSLTAPQQKHIKGIQGNVWGENIRDGAHADYMTYPRALAAAEIAWSPPSAKNYEGFLKKLKTRLAAMDKDQLGFRIPEPKGLKDVVTIEPSVQVVLEQPVDGAMIYYTLDGTEPGSQSRPYNKPFTISLKENEHTIIKVRVVLPSGRQSGVYQAIYTRKQYKSASSVQVGEKGLAFKTTNTKVSLAKDIQIATADTSGVLLSLDLRPLSGRKTLYVIFEGFVEVPDDDMYTFKVRSDDGAMLYVDEELLIDNDGEHAVTEAVGTLPLRKGFHKIRLQYFDAGGGRHLELLSGKTGETLTSIDKFYHLK